jgi:AcrR family transcriptional regulator
MRASWREQLLAADSREDRVWHAIDAWFAYVQSHPYAWRMLFRDTTGEPEIERIHREVAEQSRAMLLPVLAQAPGVEYVAGSKAEDLEMTWEGLRSFLQGLALWWYEHQNIPRNRVVTAAMNILWSGLERVGKGETWQTPDPKRPGSAGQDWP